MQYLIRICFRTSRYFPIGRYGKRAESDSDGKYDVTVEPVDTHKFKADEKGNELEVPVDDWIEIGALAAPAKGKKFGKVLYREREHMTSGKATYSLRPMNCLTRRESIRCCC